MRVMKEYSTGEQQQDIQVTAIEQDLGWQSTVKVARAGRTFYLNKCVWNMSVSSGGVDCEMWVGVHEAAYCVA